MSAPGQLRITTGTVGTFHCPTCNINLNNSSFDASIGPDVLFMPVAASIWPSISLGRHSRRDGEFSDVNFQQIIANRVTATAGQDINLSASPLMWIGNAPLEAVSVARSR